MRSAIGVLSTLVIAAALGAGCGGGNPCADLVGAINRASMAPGCAAPLANAKAQSASIDVSSCDPAQADTFEREASCFNALENCENGGGNTLQNLITLQNCLASASTPMM